MPGELGQLAVRGVDAGAAAGAGVEGLDGPAVPVGDHPSGQRPVVPDGEGPGLDDLLRAFGEVEEAEPDRAGPSARLLDGEPPAAPQELDRGGRRLEEA